MITTVAGNGTAGFSGDGGPSTTANLRNPFGLAFDAAGSLYIADASNHRIRKVNAFGVISTVAGNGTAEYVGDLFAATLASLNFPTDIAFDSADNMYIADSGNSLVRVVSPPPVGVITTIVGQGTLPTVDEEGDPVPGFGQPGFSGDGGPALNAHLNSPFSLLLDIDDQIFISDSGNQRIRFINQAGIITTAAGIGATGYGGDGGPATAALFDVPMGMVLSAGQDLIVADMSNHRLRAIEMAGAPAPTPTPTDTPTPTVTPTVTPTPTITPTGTPDCPDSDGDTLNDCAELLFNTDPADPDTDDDGCADGEEVGTNERFGGLRDPTNFWDFFDTPNALNVRERVVNILDIQRVAGRFGADDNGGLAAINRNTDPLSAPPPAPGYHPAFDRGAILGPNAWNLGPADGTINVINDILGISNQFGHTCANPP